MRELWVKIVQTGGVRIYGVIIAIITLALTTRYLGPAGRGELVTITTWVTTFSIFLHFSLGQVAIYKATSSAGKCISSAFHILFFYLIIFTFIGWLIALGILLYTPSIFGSLNQSWLLMGYILLPLLIWEQYSSSLLMASDNIGLYNRYQAIGKSVSLVIVTVVLTLFSGGVASILLADFAGRLVSALGSGKPLYEKAGGWSFPSVDHAKDYLLGGLKLHLNAIGAFLFTSSDVLMLNYYRGSEETGLYQLGMQLLGVMMIVPSAAGMVFYGKMGAVGPDRAWAEQKVIIHYILLLLILGGAFVGFTAEFWIVLIAGEEFLPAVNVFQWQLLSVIGMSFSILMAPQWIGRGYFVQASVLTLLVGIGNIIANYILIPKYGMLGAIWASIGVYMFSIIGNGGMYILCDMHSRKAIA